MSGARISLLAAVLIGSSTLGGCACLRMDRFGIDHMFFDAPKAAAFVGHAPRRHVTVTQQDSVAPETAFSRCSHALYVATPSSQEELKAREAACRETIVNQPY